MRSPSYYIIEIKREIKRIKKLLVLPTLTDEEREELILLKLKLEKQLKKSKWLKKKYKSAMTTAMKKLKKIVKRRRDEFV